jgi:hypothetical protein
MYKIKEAQNKPNKNQDGTLKVFVNIVDGFKGAPFP